MSMLLEEIQKLLDDRKTLDGVCNALKTDRDKVVEQSRTIFKELPTSAFAKLKETLNQCKEDVDSLRNDVDDQASSMSEALSALEDAPYDIEYNVADVSDRIDKLMHMVSQYEDAEKKDEEAMDMVMEKSSDELLDIIATQNAEESKKDFDDIGKETTND